jgi:hypothetical protein
MCMNFVVIGTDHRMQNSEAGFEGLLRAWLSRQFFEPLGAIAEEYADAIGSGSPPNAACAGTTST